jgi:hypothetical protein
MHIKFSSAVARMICRMLLASALFPAISISKIKIKEIFRVAEPVVLPKENQHLLPLYGPDLDAAKSAA